MKKIFIKLVCIISLVTYTGSIFGMHKVSAYMQQALAKSSAQIAACSIMFRNALHTLHANGDVLLHAAPGALHNASQQVTHSARCTYDSMRQLSHTATKSVIQTARRACGLPMTLLQGSKNLIMAHPKISKGLGASLAGIIGTYFFARSRYAQHTFHIAKLRLAYRLLNSLNIRCIRWALGLGADINHRFQDQQTALHLAAAQGRLDSVQELLAQGANLHLNDVHGFKPIHYAARNGHIDVMAYLIRSGENIDIATEDATRRSPLHVASAAGQLDMVRWLVQHGANNQMQTAEGQIAQALATAADHEDVAQYLTHILPGAADHWFTRILDNAIDQNEVQRARIAINSGAYLVCADEARTPLRRTIRAYNAEHPTPADEIAASLVQAGAPLHTIDAQGNTLLHVATRQGNVRLAKLLLDKGADIRPHNADGHEALDIALARRNGPMVQLLLENGAHLTPEQEAANAWLIEAPAAI